MPAAVMTIQAGSIQQMSASNPPSGPARKSPMDAMVCVDDGPGSAEAMDNTSRNLASEIHFFLSEQTRSH